MFMYFIENYLMIMYLFQMKLAEEDRKKVEEKEEVEKLEESIMKIIQNHLPPHTTKGDLLKSLNKRKG